MVTDLGRTLVDRRFRLVRCLCCFVWLFPIDFLFFVSGFIFEVFGFGVGFVAFVRGGASLLIGLLFGVLEPGLELRRRLGGFRAMPRAEHPVQVVLGIRAD